MITYHELVQYGLIRDPNHTGLNMANHVHPISITEDEFNFIRDYVAARKYKSGYEVATAFGVSACALGLGLLPNGGKLVSVDAYIEEQYNYCLGYLDKKQTYENSDGWRVAHQLRKHFGLEATIDFRVGWSPDDIPAILGDRKLDIVFIDALHKDRNLLDDVRVIKDRLEPPFTLMLHDSHAFAPGTLGLISEWMGAKMVQPKLPHSWNIGYFERT